MEVILSWNVTHLMYNKIIKTRAQITISSSHKVLKWEIKKCKFQNIESVKFVSDYSTDSNKNSPCKPS